MDDDHPPKMRKWEFDISKCLVCLQPVDNKVSSPSLEVLQKVYGYTKERIEYGDTTIREFWETIRDVNPADIVSSGCV